MNMIYYTIIVFCWGQYEFLWTLKTIFTEAFSNIWLHAINGQYQTAWTIRTNLDCNVSLVHMFSYRVHVLLERVLDTLHKYKSWLIIIHSNVTFYAKKQHIHLIKVLVRALLLTSVLLFCSHVGNIVDNICRFTWP
jgi:hypothetical protein